MDSILKEEKYLDYLSKLYAESTFKKGNTIVGQRIGANTIYCLYIEDNFFIMTATNVRTFNFYDSFKGNIKDILSLDIKENLFTFKISLTLKEKKEGKYSITEYRFSTSKILLTNFNIKNTRSFINKKWSFKKSYF